jgi:hypothetical protein
LRTMISTLGRRLADAPLRRPTGGLPVILSL